MEAFGITVLGRRYFLLATAKLTKVYAFQHQLARETFVAKEDAGTRRG